MVAKLKPYNPGGADLVANWHVIDAADQVLGRLASRVAMLLMGKNKPTYVPHLPAGDFVVVKNAAKIRITGGKAASKVYVSHTQQPGHRKEVPYLVMLASHPDTVVTHAVKGMLPKNKLGDRLLTRLKVYAGPEHPHAAQVTGTRKLMERMTEQAARAGTVREPVRPPVEVAAAPAAAAVPSEVKKPVRRPKAPTVKQEKTRADAGEETAPKPASAAAGKKPVRRPRAPGARPRVEESR
jgi:large subunit ribosomal protein L13